MVIKVMDLTNVLNQVFYNFLLLSIIKYIEECNPTILNSCPPHSSCFYSSINQKYLCQCKQGLFIFFYNKN